MMYAKMWALALGACLIVLGCRSEQVEIGKTGVIGAELTDYAGSWHGYAEAYKFNDGTDSVRLSLTADGAGRLEVGEMAPFTTFEPTHGEAEKQLGSTLVSGFSYPIHGAKVEAQRIRLAAHPADLYQPWCSMRTPKPVRDTTPLQYNCVGADGWSSSDGITCTSGDQQFDCALATCLKLCECTQSQCQAADQGLLPLDGALMMEGNELVGTLVLGSERVTVRLSRM